LIVKFWIFADALSAPDIAVRLKYNQPSCFNSS